MDARGRDRERRRGRDAATWIAGGHWREVRRLVLSADPKRRDAADAGARGREREETSNATSGRARAGREGERKRRRKSTRKESSAGAGVTSGEREERGKRGAGRRKVPRRCAGVAHMRVDVQERTGTCVGPGVAPPASARSRSRAPEAMRVAGRRELIEDVTLRADAYARPAREAGPATRRRRGARAAWLDAEERHASRDKSTTAQKYDTESSRECRASVIGAARRGPAS